MRVLMLSWEYPPVVVGGLGRHVHALARHLAGQGHEVVVLCRQPGGSDAATHPDSDTVVEGVRLVRVAEDPPHLTFERDLVAWTLAMGHAMVRAGHRLLAGWRPDVVHAHDWLVTHPAVALAEAGGVPLVSTVHATEAGRHSGWLSHNHNQQIHSVEWWLAHRSDAVITCSAAMRAEVATLFELPPERISVLRNGIESCTWEVSPAEVAATRAEHAPGGGPLLLYFGRLEFEKGVQDLLAALPGIRERHPGATAVIAGRGSHENRLRDHAAECGVSGAARFTGHLPDVALAALLAAADAVVLPSRYEPFGIVALEAAAAGAPLVASTAGGLAELVEDGRTGATFPPGEIDLLTDAVHRVLTDPAAAAARAHAARARLATDFDWRTIAAATAALYAGTPRRDHAPLPRPKIATGNVLGRTP